jgi:transcriptional regulator
VRLAAGLTQLEVAHTLATREATVSNRERHPHVGCTDGGRRIWRAWEQLCGVLALDPVATLDSLDGP